MRSITLTCLVLLLSTPLLAQLDAFEYAINVNTNTYLPLNSGKQRFPVLGYNKQVDPKVLIGGFGFGVSGIANWRSNKKIKIQANLLKRSYWEDPYVLRTSTNTSMGEVAYSGSDVVFNTNAVLHWKINDTFSFGTGIGGDVMLVSVFRLPDMFDDVTNSLSLNRHYKRIMPLLPFEFLVSTPKIDVQP